MFFFSPSRTLAHMAIVSMGSAPRNRLSRTTRRTMRSQVPLNAYSPPLSVMLLRAEIYSLNASGWTDVMLLLSAWMPSKMATSFFPSRSDMDGSITRICRANSYFGTKMRSPLDSSVKCSFISSMSMHSGLSRS